MNSRLDRKGSHCRLVAVGDHPRKSFNLDNSAHPALEAGRNSDVMVHIERVLSVLHRGVGKRIRRDGDFGSRPFRFSANNAFHLFFIYTVDRC
jgi:hypothetical protein